MTSFRGSSRTPTKQEDRIYAWSFSRYKTWRQCPFKLKCSAIDGLKEPESTAMLEGKRVHKLAEDYLNGTIKKMPEELKKLNDDYASLRGYGKTNPGNLFVELGQAFDKDLILIGSTDNDWFSSRAWLRVKYDALVINDDGTACVIDLKTGKMRKEDREQLSLFAMAVMLAFPEVDEVDVENWYSKTGELLNGTMYRRDLDALKTMWLEKAAPMLADTEFLPTPNPLCSYCHYRKSNGGPCKFS